MDLSVVVPLFNEEESVALLHQRVEAACGQLGLAWEVIYVDDGSTDATWSTLTELQARSGQLISVRLQRNSGQTAAMAAGFEVAKGRYIVTMDGDLQNDPKDIGMMLDAAKQGYDLVCGWRKDRQDNLISRKIPSKCANWLIRRITGVHIHDYGCSLKVYHGELVSRMRLYSDMHRFLPFVAQQVGARVGERVVSHHARQFGVSKYGIGRTWKVLLDLIGLKLLVHYCRTPLLMFLAIGLPLLAVGSVFGLLGVMDSAYRGPVPFGASFLLVSAGTTVCAAGLLGQAIASRDAEKLALVTTGSSHSQEESDR